MRTSTGVLLWLSFCFGQSSSTPAAFEVVSVKPSAPESRGMTASTDPGRFTARNATLEFLIQVAYRVREDQVSGGPKWMDSERYDVVATTVGSPTEDESRQMLQRMLAERFQLKAHRESREANIYQLTVAKGGLKVRPANAAEGRSRASMARGKITGQQISMPQLADMLSHALGQTVLDATGVKETFDVKLEWAPGESEPVLTKPGVAPQATAPAETTGPSIFGALQEQMGLKLEARKATVEVLAVDAAERPSAN
jgi:uncharacterized protein (TIGR03435 family)